MQPNPSCYTPWVTDSKSNRPGFNKYMKPYLRNLPFIMLSGFSKTNHEGSMPIEQILVSSFKLRWLAWTRNT